MIPEVEWWDGPFAQSQDLLIGQDPDFEGRLTKAVTNLVEHPVQLAAPSKYISRPIRFNQDSFVTYHAWAWFDCVS